jgi:hypothetical protein
MNFDIECVREGVHNRAAHTVKSAGYGVSASTKLATRVQNRQHNFDRRFLLDRMLVNGNPATVVDHTQRAIGKNRDVDSIAIPREGLINRVIDNFVNKVMQAALAGRADVHTGTLTDGLESFENLDIVRAVFNRFRR